MLRISVTSFWLDGFSQDEIIKDTQSDSLANIVYEQINWKIATAVCNCICKNNFYELRRLVKKQGHSNCIDWSVISYLTFWAEQGHSNCIDW